MEYNPQYDQQNDYEDNYYQNHDEYGDGQDNTVKGLKIAIGILIAVLVVLAFLFWNRVRLDNRDAELMRIQMDTLESQLGSVRLDLDQMTSDNDSLNRDLALQRDKADSLLGALKKEKNYRYSIVKKYEKELGTLRETMKGFVRQIDSLNMVNKKLSGENIKLRRENASYRTRVESAEETASELQTKVTRASLIRARNISMSLLNKRDKPVTVVRNAKKLKVTFTLSANELAQPGQRTVYVSIVNPNGAVISSSGQSVMIESKAMPYTASRDVDYNLEDITVSVFYEGTGFTTGQYTILIYMDGTTVGTSNVYIQK